MTLATSRASLNQGALNNVSDLNFTASSGISTTLTSAGNLPALADDEFFEVRNAPIAGNNGLYRVNDAGPTTSAVDCEKVVGTNPTNDGPDSTDILGETGASTEKSVMLDTARLEVAVLEQGNIDPDGVNGDAIYSFFMQEWKDDNFIIANAPFPMNAIDKDAGKYIIGQDSSGNNSGWTWLDDTTDSIRTRKLLRNMGWDEVNASGVITNRYFSGVTLGNFEDETPLTGDLPFYQFGTDTLEDDTVDFDFTGPANEAIRFFERQVDDSINGGTGIAISADGRTLTRSDGGNWRTDGYKVGGQIELRDSEDATMDGPWLLKVVGNGVDGVVTCGRAAGGASFPLAISGTDTITRADGGSFLLDGWVVGSNIIITAAEDGPNNGTHVVTAVTALTLEATGSTFTNNTDDEAMILGMFDDALTPDTTINASINNDNAVRLGIRVRDADTNGKTYGEANLVSAGKEALGNFAFAFPLANVTDLKITNTDAFIDGANPPFNGMTISFHATPQVRGGLVGGSFNFGIIIAGNDATNIEAFEWVQRQLRRLTDIDAIGTVIGRTMGLLARFNGDILEMGSGDGGLTFPVNPAGGGSGVFIDALNAGSDNTTRFFDNLGDLKQKPESIAVTLDFNAIAINDTATEYDMFYDRTIRTAVTDFVLTSGATPTITSVGTQLPNNAESGVGSYMRVSGLTGGDEPMNGVYQILVETTPGAAWDVVRYDGATIVTVTTTTVDIDQNCVDTPDAIIVDSNVESAVAADVSFTSPDTITSAGSLFAIYAIGDRIRISGSTAGLNDGIFEVLTVSATTVTTVEQTITTQGTGPTVTITVIFSGDADSDIVKNYAFDGNVQGGRTVSTPTFFKAKAVGQLGAQYIESPVSQLVSGTPLTIPLFAATERNVT